MRIYRFLFLCRGAVIRTWIKGWFMGLPGSSGLLSYVSPRRRCRRCLRPGIFGGDARNTPPKNVEGHPNGVFLVRAIIFIRLHPRFAEVSRAQYEALRRNMNN